MGSNTRSGDPPRSLGWREWWDRGPLPLRLGIIFGLLGAVLAAVGVVRDPSDPFLWRGLAMAVMLAGGSWGLVSWALATAIMEAGREGEAGGEE